MYKKREQRLQPTRVWPGCILTGKWVPTTNIRSRLPLMRKGFDFTVINIDGGGTIYREIDFEKLNSLTAKHYQDQLDCTVDCGQQSWNSHNYHYFPTIQNSKRHNKDDYNYILYLVLVSADNGAYLCLKERICTWFQYRISKASHREMNKSGFIKLMYLANFISGYLWMKIVYHLSLWWLGSQATCLKTGGNKQRMNKT